jgi:hypothetical protein
MAPSHPALLVPLAVLFFPLVLLGALVLALGEGEAARTEGPLAGP